jgi:uncharacterized SAM-binding protein YcdF (DUF218 family)
MQKRIPKPGRNRRRLVVLAGVLVALAVLAPLLAKSLLCIDSGPARQADAIILLGGGVFDRAPRAAELFQAGAARRIIVSGDGDCEENRLALIARGVPKRAIELECASRNTKENAQFTAALLKQAGAERAIIVTSWYHSRRALNTFRAFVPGVEFVSEPASRVRGIRPAYTLMQVYKEYVKLAWYWLRWKVPPWQRDYGGGDGAQTRHVIFAGDSWAPPSWAAWRAGAG